MELQDIVTESFKSVSINGILYSLNNDEKALYDKVKSEEKVLKSDLDEFTQRLASMLVSRGLLRRRKDKQHNIYFTTRGRRKVFGKRTLDEVAPPDREIEKWIGQNTDKFKEKYGKNYKTFLYGRAWNKFNGKSITESVNPLFEGVEDLQKYYPNIPLERLRELIALDPTYKGGDQLGKYGKWIIRLVYNNIKNEEMIKNYKLLLKQYPNGINPKNGQKFQEPNLLPSIKDEDLYKIKDSLAKYDIYKKELNTPIDAFKTLPELDKAISEIENKGVPVNELAHKRYKLFQKAVKKGLKIVYEDKGWIVGIPETHESSMMFGEDTRWCTTSSRDYYYNRYSKQGPLFINLNKENGDLYQFHFESEQFMDSNDYEIDFGGFCEENPNLEKFYHKYIDEKIGDPKKIIEEILSDGKKLNEWLSHKLIQVKNDDKYVYGLMDIYDIKNIYYDSLYIRDNIVSLDFIEKVLKGETWELFEFGDYNITDSKNYEPRNWKDYISPLNISWDNIIEILKSDGEYVDEKAALSEKEVKKIYEIMTDYDENICQEYRNAYESGTINDMEKDIYGELEGNLPLNPDTPFDDNYLNVKLSIEDMINIEKEKYSEFSDSWWLKLSEDRLYDDEKDWLWYWRELHYDDTEFNISSPYYGWDGFDDEYWDNAVLVFAKTIKKELSELEDDDSEDDSDDEE